MKSSTTASRALVASIIATAFLWTLVLSASPSVHGCVHSDASQLGHTCAVTFVTSGNYTHSAPVLVVSAPVSVPEFSQIRVLNSTSVRPLPLRAHIFALAPPALG